MANFRFDPARHFADNLEEFLRHIEAEDAEMATILREHCGLLLGVDSDAKRKAARTAFNNAVKSKLQEDEPATKEEA